MSPPKADKQAIKPWQKSLADALRKVSAGQSTAAGPNSALSDAIENLSKRNRSSLNEALKKVAEGQKLPDSDPAFSAAISKALHRAYELPKEEGQGPRFAKGLRHEHTGLESYSLASALRQITAGQAHPESAPTISRLAGLNQSTLTKTHTNAQAKAFRAGLRRGMQEVGSLSINPWREQMDILHNSASGALREDWVRIENDLWSTIEKMTEKLDELPAQSRIRLAKALAQYLQIRSTG